MLNKEAQKKVKCTVIPAEVDGGEIAVFTAGMVCVSVGKGAEERIGQQAGDLLLGQCYCVVAVLPQQRDGLHMCTRQT